MKKLEFYVPKAHLESVLEALFHAGAGRIGNYDSCCWYTSGMGQFRPLEGADPYVHSGEQVHREEEYKVELVFQASLQTEVISALKRAHPYETPAYQVLSIET
ncbi:NGG1p interacting factor 3 protein, NIF3 [Ferrimonas futtsuensis]|uniref:NGG1p interacting factor 3 protein, NIF3 n=1 Tax=Ferrimonas futtsuensis TaxID=364764 RepID=UPI000424A6CF|nr:NGG1p interacting factor 3 protein, NIF3 [Ferrimonas futtsuensis]